MLLKKVVICLSSMAFVLNMSAVPLFAESERDCSTQKNSNSVEIEKKDNNEEFSMFGIFNKSYYENIIKCSESIRDNAEVALKSLSKVEEVVKKDDNSENNVISDELKERFKEFLIEQNKLDGSTTELLKVLGLFSDVGAEEDIVEHENLNSEELVKN